MLEVVGLSPRPALQERISQLQAVADTHAGAAPMAALDRLAYP